MSSSHISPALSPSSALRGVNLGNWLLLERWMSPGLYPGKDQRDEYSLSAFLGAGEVEKVLRKHRETWITEDDFAWLAARGLNSVRIPFGYWILEADGPYVASPELLDFAIDCCERYGLAAVLDLHGLHGAQGPEHHTGRSKHFRWPHDAENVRRSLDFIESVAARYAGRKGVAAFSLINEPHESIERAVLVDFYEKATERVRRHMPADQVAVVIAAYPENLMPTYHRSLGETPNIWTDVHLYQSFVPWPNEDPITYLEAAVHRHERLSRWQVQGPVMVGEWSLSWGPEIRKTIMTLTPEGRDTFTRAYADIQLASFSHTTGWYFWSYRVENFPEWSFRDAVQRGWFPMDFTPSDTPLEDAFAQSLATATAAGALV